MKSIKKSIITIIPFLLLSLNILGNDQAVYDKINVGDEKDKIIQILGNPIDPDKDLEQNLRNIFYTTLPKLNNHDSKYFLYWMRNKELYFVIGFNENNKVEVKHRFSIPGN